MTPEEHEAYIAKLERRAEEAWTGVQHEKRVNALIFYIFLGMIATGVLLYFL